MKVSTYQLIASNGKPVRKATQVETATGEILRFTERMTKRQALQAAVKYWQEQDNLAAFYACHPAD